MSHNTLRATIAAVIVLSCMSLASPTNAASTKDQQIAALQQLLYNAPTAQLSTILQVHTDSVSIVFTSPHKTCIAYYTDKQSILNAWKPRKVMRYPKRWFFKLAHKYHPEMICSSVSH